MNLLNYDDQDVFATKERASACMSIIEEQQDSVKQLVAPPPTHAPPLPLKHFEHLFQVLANMNAAYKQEKKKNSKRKVQGAAPLGLKVSDAPPRPKKMKDTLFLSFPDQTVLSAGAAGDIKAELSYHLGEPDVH